ncbi:MAG: cobyric acid synthase [Deltaproteobacteria bacterium]|nr:cobyric acid synthase [Deltaproteobacteria bacterium]
MKYRPLMILGSGSDVGKSLVVAGLCRIFRQEGIRVAPFKAQNMALNSFITADGGEMGRAQVTQAQAAGLTPHVDMNPILLKPSSEVGSQVIVQGKVYGNFSAQEYYRHKPKLTRKVMESFRRLREDHELIVLEGAGSAVELNLKKNDLVNFSMAKRAGAAVLLVADIDRGGVFAATIGSFHLLTLGERRLLGGFIINKFRGDAALFKEGERIIERRTHRPVLGVLPYAPDLIIPEEDSVALSRKHSNGSWDESSGLRIGVIRLPHISNYTDFDPLEQEPGVVLRYLDERMGLDAADLVILPGTKNTISDLLYLKETGLFQQIQACARRGGFVLGICGGYQILGQEVRDPLGVEGPPRTESGLSLLPVVTTMAGAKTTTQVQARAPGHAGALIEAYEIHMGETVPLGDGAPAFEIISRNGATMQVGDGWVSPDRRVWGTYLHGLFDRDDFRRDFLAEIARACCREGSAAPIRSFRDFQEAQLDRLADLLRSHLDLGRIRSLIQL